jgi:hypothetical protein
MEFMSCVPGLLNDLAGRHHDHDDSVKLREELFFSNFHCFFELHVLRVLTLRRVPWSVQE